MIDRRFSDEETEAKKGWAVGLKSAVQTQLGGTVLESPAKGLPVSLRNLLSLTKMPLWWSWRARVLFVNSHLQ
jgi:hypothetical protein